MSSDDFCTAFIKYFAIGFIVLVSSIVFLICPYVFIRILRENEELTPTYTVPLCSLSFDSSVEDTFVLGRGSVSGKDYYCCYQVLDDGGLSLLKMDTDGTIIYPTLEIDETTEAYAEITKNGWGTIIEAKLYVPENTIQTEYFENQLQSPKQ